MRPGHNNHFQSSPRPTLLGVLPFAPGTGFTRVMAAILERLPKDWDLHCLATQGDRGHRWIDGVALHSVPATPEQPRAGEICRTLVEKIRPDVVFLLEDPPVAARYAQALAACHHRPRVVACCPVDGFLKSPRTLLGIEHVDHLVSFTEFGRHELAGCLEPLRRAGSSAPELATIPLGVDSKTFSPLGPVTDSERHCRACRALFPDRPELQGSFIILNANTCHPRKRMETTLWGFARFAEGKPENVRLYVHHLAPGRPFYAELMSLVHGLGIAGRLIPSLLADRSAASFSDARMNLLYNACAIGVNTADGEGWGLISVEHAATGAAQIVPRHSALAEIWAGAAAFLDPHHATVSAPGVERRQVASSSLAAALDELYQAPRALRQTSLSCYERATDRRWAWETVAAQWRDLLARDCRPTSANVPSTFQHHPQLMETSK